MTTRILRKKRQVNANVEEALLPGRNRAPKITGVASSEVVDIGDSVGEDHRKAAPLEYSATPTSYAGSIYLRSTAI